MTDDDPLTHRVAGEVGPAILQPLHQRRDGTYDWRLQSKRSLEAATASWVIAALEQDGHVVEELWSPDTDRSRRPEIVSGRPELAMVLDGEPTGLDVTMFTTQRAADAGARAKALQEAIGTSLAESEDGRAALAFVLVDGDGILALDRRQGPAATAAITAAFVEARRSTVGQVDRMTVATPGWAKATLSLYTDPLAGHAQRAYVMVHRGDMAAYVDTFIRERVPRKATQLAPWGRAILAIVHGFGERADDLAAGFARAGACPLWRVYWVGASHDTVRRVGGADGTE